MKILKHIANKEVRNYLVAGVLTTIISVGSFTLFSRIIGIHYIPANILSWIVAILFAYCAYRWFVFHSKEKNKVKEFANFVVARILTLLLDTGLMILLVGLFRLDDVLSKLFVQFIIIVANYLMSKFFVFKK